MIGLPGQVAASIICVIALVALVLGAFAFTRSTTTVTAEHLSYRQTGTWSYSAVAKGDVYTNGLVATGQPIYPLVAPVVQVGFNYKFVSAIPSRLTGEAGLSVVLTSSSGWSHTFPLERTISFSGPAAQLKGTINLLAIEKYLVSVEVQTGQSTGAGESYSLALEPSVHISGVLGSSSVPPETFNPLLDFILQTNQVELNYGQNNSTTKTLAQLVQSSAAGSVSVPRTTAAKLSFAGLNPSVSVSREIATWVLLTCILGLLGLGIMLRKASRAPEEDRIVALYGPILVAVERPEALGMAGSVRMESIEDLVKIAEHQNRMILHCESDSGRDYFVKDQTLAYLYSARDQSSGRRATDEAVPVVVTDAAVNGAVGETLFKDQD